jgi:hypothetical protein
LRLLDVPITRHGKSITLQLMHVRNPHATNETRKTRGMCNWKGGWNGLDIDFLIFFGKVK